MEELYTMPIIKGIKDFNWDLSRERFKEMLHSIKLLFTERKHWAKWAYVYTFILVPLLNFLIFMIQGSQQITLDSPPPTFLFSSINVFFMSILITFTICSFILSLLISNKIRPLLIASLFTQILILFFEINIIKKYTLSYTETENVSFLLLILISLSILFAMITLLKMIYLRIRASVISRRELKIS
jgi:hypothetical protein